MGEKREVGKSERLFVGLILTIAGLLGLGYGTMGYGMMGGMMGYRGMMGYGYGYSVTSIIITAIFIGVTLFGLYIIYDSVRGGE